MTHIRVIPPKGSAFDIHMVDKWRGPMTKPEVLKVLAEYWASFSEASNVPRNDMGLSFKEYLIASGQFVVTISAAEIYDMR